MKERKTLSFSGLTGVIRGVFDEIEDRVTPNKISLSDCLMAAFAMFSMKYESLLRFDRESRGENPLLIQNLKNLFALQSVPSDTRMRERLDAIDPRSLDKLFKRLFAEVQRGKGLEGMESYRGDYVISLDGTGVFSSSDISCPNCLVKNKGKANESYYHQNFCAVLTKSDCKTVLPIGTEAIVNSDGSTKNDCEFNAAKRLIPRLRREHPHLPMCLVLDGLHSKAPMVKLLNENKMRFLIIAKEGDHKHLFDQVSDRALCQLQTLTEEKDGVVKEYKFANGLEINQSHSDVHVNYLEYQEFKDGKCSRRFVWITNYELLRSNVGKVVPMGRSRWKIENETFNTLKNQGYGYEHNYGHGKQNLSVVFSTLMLLAFAVDQTLERCCKIFQIAREKAGTKKVLWLKIRTFIDHVPALRMEDYYRVIARTITLAELVNSS